jgi:hypothetical protein
MHEPHLILNWWAILVSMIACFAFGGLWYGPIVGKTWAGLMGMDCTQKPAPAVMRRAMIIQVVGLFLTTYVMAHSGQVWRPSVWGLGEDQGPNFMWGFMSGVFTWLGFYVPLQMNKVAWEGRPWKLFCINTTHDFINLQIIAQILAHWR